MPGFALKARKVDDMAKQSADRRTKHVQDPVDLSGLVRMCGRDHGVLPR
ncbi:hypothetical protein GCM10007884_04600 [Methylobacterium brachythecii]|uniref:Uncharacterized protein n=1 Tax=Methylobacterium brachythecii TaxID=1176177 RepID=A0ABQ6D1E5_9HYPH|nr:hypothetical protein GCM10007884_04600 [Methylobacterium brachythecii]